MKKWIFGLVGLISLGIGLSFLTLSMNTNKIVFDNERYELQYSAKTDFGYINEYVRANETVYNYEKMITVMGYNNLSSNVSERQLLETLYAGTQSDKYVNLYTYQPENLIISNSFSGQGFIEYTAYKIKKLDNNKLTTMHFTQKYRVKNVAELVTGLSAKIRENDKKYVKLLNSTPIPNVIKTELDKGKK